MIPLGVIMDQVLLDRIIQGTFTQHDHLLQGFLFDRAHKSFAVRVEVWVRGGRRIDSTPLSLSNASNACVNLVSLSWSR